MDRNPLIEPAAGDWLTNGTRTVVIHEVARGQVYYALWANDKPNDVELCRVRLECWLVLCQESKASVIPESERVYSQQGDTQ